MQYYIFQNPEDPRKKELKEEIVDSLSKQGKITDNPSKAELITVLGGDGTMLDAIHELHKYQKPFFGVNCGTVGFLLNNIQKASEMPEIALDLELVTEPFLQATFGIPGGVQGAETVLAINDILLCNEIQCYPEFSIKNKDTQKEEIVRGSSLLISSAIGSTGYRANGMGTMIPTGTKHFGFLGILSRPFTNRVAMGNYEIGIQCRDSVKALIDGTHRTCRGVSRLNDLKYSDKTFTLGFLKDNTHSSFQTKRFHLFVDRFQKMI